MPPRQRLSARPVALLLLVGAGALTACATTGDPPPAARDPAAAPAATPTYLLIRSDDGGMTHAVTEANRRLLERGLPLSVSIMFPTPWWQEVVELLRRYPETSVGIHLTLNSEWGNYRWGPVIGRSAAPSLVDEDGYFFPSSQDLYDNGPVLAEVEAELRAQIERAFDTGLRIDYVDFHMGTVRRHPDFLAIARRLADEYGLLMSGFNDEVMWDPQYRAAPEDKPDSLAAMVAGLDSRLNVVITHPGLNTPEMAALEDMNVSQPLESMAMHRQGELDALLSPEFARAVERRGVRLITYRQLREMLGMPPATGGRGGADAAGDEGEGEEERVLESALEVLDVETGRRRVVRRVREHIEAPNWTPDGGHLIYNGGGRLYRVPVAGGKPSLIDTGSATRLNNDHGISPDGTRLVISDQSAEDGRSRIHTLPIGGGEPRLVTPLAPSYWHGWSPDGRTLAYVADRGGDYDIYTIPVDGGPETRLTTAPGLDDGPDYTPDGRWIYFNSVRTGTMQIWRMGADGSDQEQVTFDAWNDWFPHPSPDGRRIVFLSYEPDVEGHPPNRDVMLRMLPIEDPDPTRPAEPRLLARLFGGQGTINVPSWSPDGRSFAFVSYRLVEP